MNLIPLFALLDANAAPPHAKVVISGLLTCAGYQKVTREHFNTDPDLQALNQLDLVTWEAGCLVVTVKAYKLAGMNPSKTKRGCSVRGNR